MSTIRTIPTHEIVRRVHPRPEPEEPERVAMAAGKAIDGALAELGYQLRLGRRPSGGAIRANAATQLREALEASAVRLSAPEEERILAQVDRVVRAYRGSPLAGLARPKSRVILIGGKVGVYAQPDYWDGRARFYEMKSYPAVPVPPDVALQLRLFQLAFPGFESVLVCLNRHVDPVESTTTVVPPPAPREVDEVLRLAHRLGLEFGTEKVLEYMEGPFVAYPLPDGAPPAS